MPFGILSVSTFKKVAHNADAVRRLDSVFLLALLFCSLLTNVLLLTKERHLSANILALKQPTLLHAGQLVSPFDADDLQGHRSTLSFSKQQLPTLMYVFQPSCAWCKRNLPNLRALISQSNGRYRVVGISLVSKGLEAYALQNDLTIPIYSELSAETIQALHLGGTPTTILVSPEGRVESVWIGAYDRSADQQISRQLGVSLANIPLQPSE